MGRIKFEIVHNPIKTQFTLIEYSNCDCSTDTHTVGKRFGFRTEVPNNVIQGFVGILSYPKSQMTELFRVICLEYFDLIRSEVVWYRGRRFRST